MTPVGVFGSPLQPTVHVHISVRGHAHGHIVLNVAEHHESHVQSSECALGATDVFPGVPVSLTHGLVPPAVHVQIDVSGHGSVSHSMGEYHESYRRRGRSRSRSAAPTSLDTPTDPGTDAPVTPSILVACPSAAPPEPSGVAHVVVGQSAAATVAKEEVDLTLIE